MGFIYDAEAISDAMVKCLQGDGESRIAIAFWGTGAVQALSLNRAARAVRVLVNAETGGSNPDELEELRRCRRISVRSHGRLHAKVVIGPDAMVVGSANASANGLGLEGSEVTGWKEAVVRSRNCDQLSVAKEWFDSLWAEAAPLDDAMLEQAREMRSRVRSHSGLVRRALRTPAEIRVRDERRIYVVVTNGESEHDFSEVRAAARKLGVELPKGYDHYEGWPQIPLDAVLLSFQYSKIGASAEGLWETRPEGLTIRVGKVTAYPVAELSTARAENLAIGDLEDWVPSVNAACRVLRRKANREGISSDPDTQIYSGMDWCIRLDDYVRLCRRHGLSCPIV